MLVLVLRFWSLLVALVLRELRCLGRCAPRLFEFIAYLTGLNSNPSGSLDSWVAARPSGSLAGGPGARRCKACLAVPEFIEELLQLPEIEYEQSLCLIDDGFGVYEIMDDDDPRRRVMKNSRTRLTCSQVE
ncbi:hypothetical protein Taro_017108 [Colocasia esculenta]|uniref:Secreted protein n=1 Tax=Colocasia esculenta TaxID=4460 RepID=A0A843USC8_COLES|nr:hypothetical protein [Colocasia esculenta]